jgi:UDP-glucose 4-epimerase
MIIVTGAAGFIGSNIVKKLHQERGADLIAIDNLLFGYKKNVPDGIQLLEEDFENIPYRCKPKDTLIHCATSNIIYSMKNQVETFKNNALKTMRLFRTFPGKIIYLSTSSVYGNPDAVPINESSEIRLTNAYDTSKYIAEVYLEERGNYTVLRLTNTYGENQRPENPYCGVVGRLIGCSLTGETFHINNDGTDTRDYIYVQDIVDAVIRAFDRTATNTEMNLGTGAETSVNELVGRVEAVSGKTIKRTNQPGREIDTISRRCMDTRKAQYYLGWVPATPLQNGLIKTFRWMAGTFKEAAL